MPLLNGSDRATIVGRLRAGPPAEDQTRLLRRHGLAAALRPALQALDLWDELSAPLAQLVREARRQQRILALQCLECMDELGAGLRRAGVPHVFLKGPLLALRVYGELEARSVGDVDLLVTPESAELAEITLHRLGFEPRYRTLGGRRLTRAFTHHFAFLRGRWAVELHWLPAREAGVRIDLARFWERVEPFEALGARHPVPDLESSLLVLVLTVAKDLELGHFRLRSAVDALRLVEALEGQPGSAGAGAWPERFDRFGAQGLGRLAPLVLDLVLGLLEARGRFPQLERAIARRPSGARAGRSATSAVRVFGLRPPAWGNKLRLFPMHRGGWIPAWAWWASSAAWRLRAYRG